MTKPIIGITMGDAAGIGPEIIIKGLSDPELYDICSPLVVGDVGILERAAGFVNIKTDIHPISTPEEAVFQPGIIDCLDLELLLNGIPLGQISGVAGHAAYSFVKKAVELCLTGDLHAVCTAPLNKEALQKGGHDYPGHTEILAELTATQNFSMLFSSEKLSVMLVTIHVGLLDAVKMIDPARVYRVIKLANHAMMQMGHPSPRIGICGINPHAGEGGLFGYREEEEKILPAVKLARKENLQVSDPLPADTVFYRAIRGEFDIVVAMYHDQGLIPIKTIGMQSAVNITVGLPIIRTSVDHGTAFDIAGKGIADDTNLKHAVRKAVEIVGFRNIQNQNL